MSIAPSLLPHTPERFLIARRLQQVVRAQELFDRTLRPIGELGDTIQASERSLWSGIGVGSQRVSIGLPLDTLILVYAQELTRRALGLRHSYLLIADTNAMRSGLDRGDVENAAYWAEYSLRRVVEQLGFPTVVERASTFVDLTGISRPNRLQTRTNPYVSQQLMQMEWMRRRGAAIKLGWRLSSALADERAFDRLYTSTYGRGKLFLYTTSGRTLDPKRPRACPYLCEDPQRRLLLAPDEDIESKLAPATDDPARAPVAAGYRRLLGKLARAHVRLTGDGDAREPEAVLQGLLARL